MNKSNQQLTEPFVMIPLKIFTDGCYLTPKARAVYCALKTFENKKTGRCFPSIKTISERSGYKKDAVIEGLKELEEFQWIVRNKHKGKSTSYFFSFPVVTEYGHSVSPTKTEAGIWREWITKKTPENTFFDVLSAEIIYSETICSNFKDFFRHQLSLLTFDDEQTLN